jgi:hypothetical protein
VKKVVFWLGLKKLLGFQQTARILWIINHITGKESQGRGEVLLS